MSAKQSKLEEWRKRWVPKPVKAETGCQIVLDIETDARNGSPDF